MSDNKKYYYMRLQDHFFESDAIRLLQTMKDGYLFSDILLKLYLKSLNTEGRLLYRDELPYTVEVLATLTGHRVSTVKKALEAFRTLHLIEELENGIIYMSDIQLLIGSSSTEADRQREYKRRISRDRAAAENISCEAEENSPESCKKSNILSAPEKEKEEKTEPETESDTESETLCSVPEDCPEPPVFSLLLNDKSRYPVLQKDIIRWQELYPATDVLQELRNMEGWLESNPARRKTRSGIRRFVNSWLSREQDKGHSAPAAPDKERAPSFYDMYLEQTGGLE